MTKKQRHMKHYTSKGLPPNAMPTEWNQLSAARMEDELRVHRFMRCQWYSKCLDHASGLRWQGWSCHWCPLNNSDIRPTKSPQMTREEAEEKEREALDGLRRLQEAIRKEKEEQ